MVNVRRFNKEELGKSLIPEKIYRLNFKEEFEKVYEKLHFDHVNPYIITNFFFLSILLSLTTYIFIYPYIYSALNIYIELNFVWKFGIIFITWFLTSLSVYYLILLFYFLYHQNQFRRIQDEIERDFPEFLDNIISNIKGGISLEKAFIKSVRVEQEALLREVTLLNEKILMGETVNDALEDFKNRFDSAIIQRTVGLIQEGLRGGGNLSVPLERISLNLKRIYYLDEEMKSNTSGFSIVIRMITVFISPLLFALALTLLVFIGDLLNLLSNSGADVFSTSTLPVEFPIYLKYFSFSMIGLIVFFSSLITSELKNEKAYEAIKYVPLFTLFSLFLYFFFSDVLLSFFSGILG